MNYEEYLKENPEFADRKRQKKAKKTNLSNYNPAAITAQTADTILTNPHLVHTGGALLFAEWFYPFWEGFLP